jgi:hypothetical protein
LGQRRREGSGVSRAAAGPGQGPQHWTSAGGTRRAPAIDLLGGLGAVLQGGLDLIPGFWWSRCAATEGSSTKIFCKHHSLGKTQNDAQRLLQQPPCRCVLERTRTRDGCAVYVICVCFSFSATRKATNSLLVLFGSSTHKSAEALGLLRAAGARAPTGAASPGTRRARKGPAGKSINSKVVWLLKARQNTPVCGVYQGGLSPPHHGITGN